MNINEILKGIDCSCGKHYTCPIEAVHASDFPEIVKVL